MSITLLYITCNRLAYTRLSLPRLLADPDEEFELVIWDNGSTDGTVEYLRDLRDPRIKEVVCRPRNEGQWCAVNYAWSHSAAQLVGKVDNDCLMQPGWTRTLAAAHRDEPTFGGIGCWSFMPSDFDPLAAAHKIRRFGGHEVLMHPHIGGSGFLLKRSDYKAAGRLPRGGRVSQYWLRLARSGRVNGWYHPLIYQEHMDDPQSAHCLLPEAPVNGDVPFAFSARGFTTRTQYGNWLREDARRIQRAPSQLVEQTEWLPRIRRLERRLLRGLRRFWKSDSTSRGEFSA